MSANESWMPKTTMDNLILLRDRLSKRETVPSVLNEIIEELRKRKADLKVRTRLNLKNMNMNRIVTL